MLKSSIIYIFVYKFIMQIDPIMMITNMINTIDSESKIVSHFIFQSKVESICVKDMQNVFIFLLNQDDMNFIFHFFL